MKLKLKGSKHIVVPPSTHPYELYPRDPVWIDSEKEFRSQEKKRLHKALKSVHPKRIRKSLGPLRCQPLRRMF